MIKTFRDHKTGKIFTEQGEHISDFNEYGRRVRAGEISGTPEDVSKMPNNIRTPDGGIGTKLAGIDKFKNQTRFLDAVKDIVRRKQRIQQPLTEQKAYWRTLQRDTTPFGGERAPEAQLPGQFTDKRFREMSPADQASVRASRYGATQAHLQGIREEEEYRGTRVEDIISSMTDLLAEKDKLADNELANAQKALNIIKSKKEQGIPITQQDYKSVGVTSTDGKTGGSVSWRHNNPGNIKFGNFAKKYGATKGQAGTDGGSFAIFPDVETGKEAIADLLRSRNYIGLSVDSAMKRWSNKGYGLDVWGDSEMAQSTIMKNLSDNQISDLIEHMIQREGWKEGTILGDTGDDMSSLSELTGLSVGELKTLSVEEREILESAYKESTKSEVKKEIEMIGQEDLYKQVDKKIADEKQKETDPNLLYAMLIRLYSEKFTDAQLKSSMIQGGFEWNGITNSWE